MRRVFPVFLLCALSLGLVVSCAGSGSRRMVDNRWMEDGVEQGTIKVIRDETGSFHEYYDTERLLVRRERRRLDGGLDASVAAQNFLYDDEGRESELAYTDADGEEILGPNGFAVRATGRRDGVTNETYYDSHRAPLVVAGGYHREESVRSGSRLVRQRFFDADDQLVGVDFELFSDVVEIRYDYLRGVTPIVYATYFGADGELIGKQRRSGETRGYEFYAGAMD